MGKFEDEVIKKLETSEMLQDAKKSRSSQFHKKVVPAIKKLNEIRKEVIVGLKSFLKETLDLEALSEEYNAVKNKSTVDKIKKIQKVLESYKKDTLSKKKKDKNSGKFKNALDDAKLEIIDAAIKHAKNWIAYFPGFDKDHEFLREKIRKKLESEAKSTLDQNTELQEAGKALAKTVNTIVELAESSDDISSGAIQQIRDTEDDIEEGWEIPLFIPPPDEPIDVFDNDLWAALQEMKDSAEKKEELAKKILDMIKKLPDEDWYKSEEGSPFLEFNDFKKNVEDAVREAKKVIEEAKKVQQQALKLEKKVEQQKESEEKELTDFQKKLLLWRSRLG